MQGGGGNVIEPLVNIDGIGDFGSPHDPTGEVGLDHFIQAVNVTRYAFGQMEYFG